MADDEQDDGIEDAIAVESGRPREDGGQDREADADDGWHGLSPEMSIAPRP